MSEDTIDKALNIITKGVTEEIKEAVRERDTETLDKCMIILKRIRDLMISLE